MKKIYCFNNGGSIGWMNAVAIAEDGTCVAQHGCSSEVFMKHDLGITTNRKHDNYDAHYGEGNWELEWVADVPNHKDLQAALVLNSAMEQVVLDKETPK